MLAGIELDQVVGVTQTAFFMVVGIVTVLTYRRARKSLLAPFRAEIFKSQLAEFQRILEKFVGKQEGELEADFGWIEIFEGNCSLMYAEYAERFLKAKIESVGRPHVTVAPNRMAIMRSDELVEVWDSHKPPPRPGDRDTPSPWSEYKHVAYAMPDRFFNFTNEMREISSGPLVPSECVALLNEYSALVHDHLMLLGAALTEAAKDMPMLYPTPEDLNDVDFSWIRNRIRERPPVGDCARRIVEYVRAYYDTDNLLAA